MTETPSYVVHTGDGVTTDFVFPFPYLDPSHVKVTVDGVEATFELISQNTLRVSSAPAEGTRVRIFRQTPSEPLTSWADGAVILGKDLNLAATQPAYVAQEGRDVSNEAYYAANQAAASAAEAAESAANAVEAAENASQASVVHAERAEAAADAAQAAATAANLSASSALGSATVAAQKAAEAANYAARAENAALVLEEGHHMHQMTDIVGLPDALDSKSDVGHDHDDRYYQKGEVDTALAGKADIGHLHDDRYYTESEIDQRFAAINGGAQAGYDSFKEIEDHLYALTVNLQGKQADLGLTGKATAADLRANNANKALEPNAVWAAAQFQTVPFAPSMTIDFANGWNATIVMTGNGTLENPLNIKPGQAGVIEIYQDATGDRLMSFGSAWRFAGNDVPDLSTGANKKDVLVYFGLSDGTALASLAKDVP